MKFIHFGCWNNGGCSEIEANDLSRVMESLRNEQNPTPDFITICGDNYYPMKNIIEKVKTKDKEKEKGDKKKIFSMTAFNSGFNCLPKDIPIHMIFGNHDYETGLYLTENNTQETDCVLLQSELDKTKNSNIHIHFCHVFSPNHSKTLIIMLDTTAYDGKNIAEYIQCYKKINVNYTNPDIVKESQKTMLIDKLNVYSPKQFKNIIIIGHHPITNYKWKKDNLIVEHLSDEFDNLLHDVIYSKFGENAIYTYLCADIHHYQRGTVTIKSNMKLTQHIVGTGGANKDEFKNNEVSNQTIAPNQSVVVQYQMNTDDIAVSGMKNGYLKCVLGENDVLSCDFHEVHSSKGGKRKTSKYFVKSRKTHSLSPHSRKVKNPNRKTKSRRGYRNTK